MVMSRMSQLSHTKCSHSICTQVRSMLWAVTSAHVASAPTPRTGHGSVGRTTKPARTWESVAVN